jgi:hypothetical protein
MAPSSLLVLGQNRLRADASILLKQGLGVALPILPR